MLKMPGSLPPTPYKPDAMKQPTPGPSQGQPELKGMLVDALRGIKNAAEQQGLDFQTLLAEAEQGPAGKKMPMGPPSPPMGM